jgi:hypothetical protein
VRDALFVANIDVNYDGLNISSILPGSIKAFGFIKYISDMNSEFLIESALRNGDANILKVQLDSITVKNINTSLKIFCLLDFKII